VHFEVCIVVEVGQTGRDLDWVSHTLEACLASRSIASVAAFGDCLSSVEAQAEVDAAIVEDEIAVELRERQSLKSHVVETAEPVEVATSDFVVRNYTGLRSDPCHLKVGLGLVTALAFDQSATRLAACPARETEPEDFVGVEVASRFGHPSDAANPDLTTLVVEYCLR
jgi:hypothetical protein